MCSSQDERHRDNRKSTTPMNVPACTSLADCRKHDGKLVEIVGTYSEIMIPSKRAGSPPLRFPALDVTDEKLYLGVAWAGRRPESERKRFFGKAVRVRGTFQLTRPRDPAAQPGEVTALAGGPTIHPVDSIVEENRK
jgi:hypothetical protein